MPFHYGASWSWTKTMSKLNLCSLKLWFLGIVSSVKKADSYNRHVWTGKNSTYSVHYHLRYFPWISKDAYSFPWVLSYLPQISLRILSRAILKADITIARSCFCHFTHCYLFSVSYKLSLNALCFTVSGNLKLSALVVWEPRIHVNCANNFL